MIGRIAIGRRGRGWLLSLGLLPLFLAACEAVNDGGEEPQTGPFILSGCKGPPGSAKPAASASDSTGLRVLYISADSLHFIVPMVLNCGLRYTFTSASPSPDTLAIASHEAGGSAAKCVCTKELTVSLKARPGQALDLIKVVKADSTIFSDFH